MPPVPTTLPIRTHLAVDERFSGRAVEVGDGRAVIELETTPEMAVNGAGLVHGGFLFSAADYAAMLAVNEPTVVLAAAEVRFRAPVRVGRTVRFEAEREAGGPVERPPVRCTATCEGVEVFAGRFRCVVPPRHVLEEGS
jgi:acyl-coenzyme A thioesterase PaaI-like protein